MHEYSLVQDLFDQVAAQARTRGATAVRKVTVGVGELAGVNPDLFATAFETFRAASPFPEAQLIIHRVAARWVCSKCNRPITCGAVLRCLECDGPGRLETGDELVLERIELEVPKPQALRE